MDLMLAIVFAAVVMLAAVQSSMRTGHPARHRGGAPVAEILARLAAEQRRASLPAAR
ncbi:hypothetical protein [Nocardia tengchongensis]|uniref:hypothetical protein n=1 Tax=Nocardia tengchongensis TaxID=2055889 RepID=UPI0033D64BA5